MNSTEIRVRVDIQHSADIATLTPETFTQEDASIATFTRIVDGVDDTENAWEISLPAEWINDDDDNLVYDTHNVGHYDSYKNEYLVFMTSCLEDDWNTANPLPDPEPVEEPAE